MPLTEGLPPGVLTGAIASLPSQQCGANCPQQGLSQGLSRDISIPRPPGWATFQM